MKNIAATENDSHRRFQQESITCLDALYRNALGLVRNPTEAEDLVQETYLKAYHYRNTYQEGSNLKAWLFKIQFNNFIRQYRRATLERTILRTIADPFETFDGYDDNGVSGNSEADKTALRPIIKREITKAIQSLPHDYQLMVTLVDVEGLKYREIAEIIGVPIGTVMSRIHRARKMLRDRVNRREGEQIAVETQQERQSVAYLPAMADM